jgi:hypothetical protein
MAALEATPPALSPAGEQIDDGEPLNDCPRRLFVHSAHALTEWAL